MGFHTLDDVEVRSRRVLLRVDLNVPITDGKITDLTRIKRVAPTIEELSCKGARVILLAHFGRPKGRISSENSLKKIVREMEKILNCSVHFSEDCIGDKVQTAVAMMRDGDILLLENTRFYAEEEKNDPEFAKALAVNGDIYVNDAFSAAHRAHASTEGLARLLPAYAGRSMQAELESLENGLGCPIHPLIAIVGGAKVSTKIELLNSLIDKVDTLVIGGGMANTFLAAQGLNVGKSLCEYDLVNTAQAIMIKAKSEDCTLVLPVDAVIASHFRENVPYHCHAIDSIPVDGMILDIGSKSIECINKMIDKAATLVWNGPLGAFELRPFDLGTVQVAKRVSERTKAGRLISIAGGGDTVAALNHAGVAGDFTYLSMAGGAFLEWMEGKSLPGVRILENKRL
ncbi:MAG: phosphoglycerate kinase [Candidatus Tokpelaia sp. JSC188]|nr:MAG: phosphoglycerate kinase [Candidatus Tokpelaia sp. JSC188]